MIGWLSAGAAVVVAGSFAAGPRLLARHLRPKIEVPLTLHGSVDARAFPDLVGATFQSGARARLLEGRGWRQHCDTFHESLRPFAYEGAGFARAALCSLGHARWSRFVPDTIERSPAMEVVLAIGAGYWTGFRYGRRWRRVAALGDVLGGDLQEHLFDGYGFKVGYCDLEEQAWAARDLLELPPELRRPAMRGVGRALWFLALRGGPSVFERIEGLGVREHDDLAVGVGVAAGFAYTHRADHGAELVARAPAVLRSRVSEGIEIGRGHRLKATPRYLRRVLLQSNENPLARAVS